ncbi:prolyl oligopeptidase family serine peptidase [Jatrophihabitans sp.]|uniref:prolyl oligopeptidase family serine peptidase n=1 Tax=Jatrophihabitans sp. TaxID=1932789 RepID=UPI002C0EE1D5|nr:prolyl oligopeptidase family serine peptidase [Jatrophihabitans sp.]
MSSSSLPGFPQTRTVDQVDDFFGTAVPDPYRWLEDQTSSEVGDWVRAQAETAERYLQGLPGRDRLTARLRELIALPSSSAPVPHGGRWFRLTNDGSQQQSVLRMSEEPMGAGQVLLDPNPAAPDGSTAIAAAVADRTGSLLAWSYQEAGSDWCRWRVRSIESGADLPDDDLRWAKFVQPCWLADSSGFLYALFPPSDPDDIYSSAAGAPRLMLHRIGTDQADDELVFELPDQPTASPWPWIDHQGRWLVVVVDDPAADTRSVWVRDLDRPGSELRQVVEPSGAQWAFVTALPAGLVLHTDFEAGRGRLVLLDPSSGAISTLVAEREHLLLGASAGAGALVLSWLADARSLLTVHDLAGAELRTVELPGLGTVSELSADEDSDLMHLVFSSFQAPPVVLRHELSTGRTSVVFDAAAGLELPAIVTDQIWVTSADGTRLPAFVVHRADVTAGNGPHPCTLYGYGGFYVSVTPEFSPGIAAFVEAGGVWVVATLRGGGEYGAQWHDAGRRDRKQNVFDDAIATAEELIAAGWTTPDRLALNGGSNGGLLVGAVMTQRPELFAAAVPQVGVMDMLRFDRFTIGWAWVADYGQASRSKAEFDVLHAYSPYHRLRPEVRYPATLVMTADHDDRVVPAHSFKFAARLQAVSPPGSVAYLRVQYSAGHGQGKSRSTQIAERTDLLAFIGHHTGLDFDTPDSEGARGGAQLTGGRALD